MTAKLPVIIAVIALVQLANVGVCATPPVRRAVAVHPEQANFEPVQVAGKIPPEFLQPPTEDFRIGAGDKLELEIMQVEGTRQLCQVMPDGRLYFHTLSSVKAAGLTVPELKATIEAGLMEFYKSPQVSIILRGIVSQRVWVLGRVNTPGLYPLDKPVTVIEAISRAGGLFSSRFSGTTEELADLKHSFLVREGEFVPVDFYKLLRDGDLSQNIYLRSGDYIFLPSSLSQEVYVMGAVKQPQAVGFSDQVTLVSAISNAKGVLPGAYAKRVVIIRGSLSNPTVATVNLDAVLSGKAPDVALEPRDIVWVPNSPWQKLGEFTKGIVNSFVRTVSANEGGRAVAPSTQPVQPTVNVGGQQSQ